MTATAKATTTPVTVPFGGGFITLTATAAQTNGQFGMIDFVIAPGQEPPLHVHEREDELFYVLDGRVDFFLDSEVIAHERGGSVFLPRGIPHTFRVRSAEARLLSFYTPGGFEEYFRESHGTPDNDLLARYGCRFVG
jgi:quercetin dioxygenase-like cupin family protein